MYIMQDVVLSTDYETNIQSLIEACERHMAKEKKESCAKCTVRCKHSQGTGQAEPNPIQEKQQLLQI